VAITVAPPVAALLPPTGATATAGGQRRDGACEDDADKGGAVTLTPLDTDNGCGDGVDDEYVLGIVVERNGGYCCWDDNDDDGISDDES
jgi:hypothetical protein